MNYNETNLQTASALQRLKQRNIFANNWESAARNVSSLAVSKKTIESFKPGEDTFLEKSRLFPELVANVNLDDISIVELVALSQAAKAIEDGDTRAAMFIRDSAGCKPVEKIQQQSGNIGDLSDAELDFLLANAEVIDEDN
jgi:hypothetical protein